MNKHTDGAAYILSIFDFRFGHTSCKALKFKV
jgi:hypothetical protein